ncbi:S9 family peptidase [Sulfidibacter corallicola]|uniref:prolyl oligopeptidase n=1 Tax=Sulfidibacter corallicola TaxID=2818388 RepID=A0A8A4THV5_SULCO|nr:prolyl oligopeptidase family serine peptidase [Sulfidibacter corallicola]QTD48401.1 S9 family peptidase [Sulfidibacter corallicola]
MKYAIQAVLMILCTSLSVPLTAGTLTQPVAKRVPVSNEYHGHTVVDPYQWLEQMSDDAVRSWVMDQDAFARQFIKNVPGREGLRARLKRINDVARIGRATLAGGKLFFAKSRPGVGILSVWVQPEGGEARRLLTRNGVEKGSVLKGFVPSPDGRYLAYYFGPSSSRWVRIKIMDLTRGAVLGEVVTGLNTRMASLTWARNSQSFYYERFKLPKKGGELTETFHYLGIYQHRPGQPQAKDQRISVGEGETNWYFAKSVLGEGRYLVQIGRNDKLRVVSIREEGREDATFRELFHLHDPVGFVGDYRGLLYFQTNDGASRGRIVAVDPKSPEPEHWKEVVPQSEHTLVSASLEGDRLLLSYRVHARPELHIQSLSGKRMKVPIPNGGFFGVGPGAYGDGLATIGSSSLVDPGSIYRLDVKRGKVTLLARTESSQDPDDFVIRQEFFQSKDGTRVPMFIVERKGADNKEPGPLFMYGYGAGSWSAFPWYQPHLVAWLEMGGRYALPGCRGGGEYGATWHQAGIRHHKQNGIDDFIGAAEHLIRKGYTTNKLLAINGGSASGQLVAAALVQRPDLFGAALIEWPAIDMLRFKQYPGGKYWVWGNGDPDVAEDFAVLRKWSPYQNVAEGTCYPPTMLLLGEKDESTVAAHGYKFQAALQHAQRCEAPILTRMIWDGGHYQYGNHEEQTLDSWIDILSFLIKVLDIDTTSS